MKMEIETFSTKDKLPKHGEQVLFGKKKIGKFSNNNETPPHFYSKGRAYWLEGAVYTWCRVPDLTK